MLAYVITFIFKELKCSLSKCSVNFFVFFTYYFKKMLISKFGINHKFVTTEKNRTNHPTKQKNL